MTPHLRLMLLMSRAVDTVLAVSTQQLLTSGASAEALNEFVPAVERLRKEISGTAAEVIALYELGSCEAVVLPSVPKVPDRAQRG